MAPPFLLFLTIFFALLQNTPSFAFTPEHSSCTTPISLSRNSDLKVPTTTSLHLLHNRRSFLTTSHLSILTATVTLTTQPLLTAAAPLLTDKSTPDLPPFASTSITEAKNRFLLAIRDIDSLLANYDTISTNGDNVRLYLGTQGIKSHMYGISKVLKFLKDEAEDIVEYTEALNEFEAYLFQAEGAAYQSLFVEHSSAKSTPESLLRTAKGDVVMVRKFMGVMAGQLGMEV
mmetsp:Transcript_5940/g.11783  ORF Transcript_5940/g.11783 Transcript_5940/m.11783 type:complete len:231 (+) Transcript_5940:70-762(+)